MHIPDNAKPVISKPLEITAEDCCILITNREEASEAFSKLKSLPPQTMLELYIFSQEDKIGFTYILNEKEYAHWSYIRS